jgi:hypothetical protein
MLNPSLQAGVAAPHVAVPCKGTTAENDHRHDRYQWVTDYNHGQKKNGSIALAAKCCYTLLDLAQSVAIPWP